MGFMSRKPDSNDPPRDREGRWLDTDEFADEFFLLVSERAHRCRDCHEATSDRYLRDGKCPDCRPDEPPIAGPVPLRRRNYGASGDSDHDAE